MGDMEFLGASGLMGRGQMWRVAIVGVVLFLAGCRGSTEALSDHLKTKLPAGARVVNFAGEGYKDPWYIWEIAPADPGFVQALVANSKLAPAPPGMDCSDPTLRTQSWWPGAGLSKMTEMYFRDPDAKEGSIYRVWVDKERNRIFILFLNT